MFWVAQYNVIKEWIELASGTAVRMPLGMSPVSASDPSLLLLCSLGESLGPSSGTWVPASQVRDLHPEFPGSGFAQIQRWQLWACDETSQLWHFYLLLFLSDKSVHVRVNRDVFRVCGRHVCFLWVTSVFLSCFPFPLSHHLHIIPPFATSLYCNLIFLPSYFKYLGIYTLLWRLGNLLLDLGFTHLFCY